MAIGMDWHDDRIARTVKSLMHAAGDADMVVSGDGRVSEADAAVLLGYAPNYLKQMRAVGRGPVAYRLGLIGARVSYRIEDLSRWIEERRNSEPVAVNVS